MVRNIETSRFQALIASRLFSSLAGLALLLMLCFADTLSGQTTGTLTGVVKDSTGAIVPGAKVTLVNTKEKSVRSTTSSGDGFFSIAAVQTGTYDLNIALAGFEAYRITGIEMHPGDSKTISTIALKIGRVQETVTVSSTAAGVDLSSGDKSYLITDEDIKRLSTVGRDVSELIRTLPGFAVAGGGLSASLNNDSTNNNSQVMGFSSSTIGSFAANGAGPGTGAVAVVSDGANTTDPADAASSIGNVNMEMVAEVKVQTSNFGADSAKGPVVLNAISKSGGTSFHGSVYGYARNSALNSNDWIDNYFDNRRAGTYNYYPGGNIGGPIIIPHTNFNHSRKLHFFAGAEGYDQRNLYGNTATLSFVPTERMLAGDLTTDSIESALNLGQGASNALAPNEYSIYGLNNFGAAYSPRATYDVQGNLVNGIIPVADFDPNVSAYTRFYPKPNRVPQPQGAPVNCTQQSNVFDSKTNQTLLAPGQLCSDNINYDSNIFGQHNGLQYHGKVDEDISDSTKLYVTYDYEKVSDQSPVTNTYYAGSPQNIIPSPVGALSNAYAHRISVNQTKTFGPTLTNEAQLAGVYFHSPAQLQNTNLLKDENTGFVGPRFYSNGADQLPEIINFQGGVPDFAMGYFNPNFGEPKRKYSVDVSDNITKQLQRHSLKAGVYLEQSANNEYVQGYNDPQGQLNFSSYNSCNLYSPPQDTLYGTTTGFGNSVANFLNGCAGFQQVNKFQSGDMKFKTVDVFVQDEWKATKKLTITAGIRFDHLGPWVDVHGQGLAVWEPTKISQNVVYNLDPKDPTTWPGIAWHNGKGITLDSSLPLSGRPSRFLFYSPRGGLAYDLYGDGKTTFRGGWGAYRFHDSYYTADGPLLTSLGVSIYNTSNNNNLSCTLAQIGNSGAIAAGRAPTTLIGSGGINAAGQICGLPYNPFTIAAADGHDDQQPVTYNYSFNVDQQLGHSSLLELSYVGNQTQHSLTGGSNDQDLSDQNAIQLGGLYKPDPNTSSTSYGAVAPYGLGFYNDQDWRPYPNYTHVQVANHIAYSNYNSFQGAYIKQRGSLTYNLNYTWSKALGVRGTGSGGTIGDSLNMRNDYGLLPFNRKQAVNITFSYQEGTKFHGNRILGGFLNQWEASGITSIQSGPDVAAFSSNFGLYGGYEYVPAGSNVLISTNFNGIAQLGTPSVTVQPVVTCNPKENLPKGVNSSGARTFINGSCFSLPPIGQNGTFNLPDIHGPMYFNSDLTLFKNFKIKEGQGLQFRAAAFNYLNHPNWQLYGGPAAGLGLGFGLPPGLSTLGHYPTSAAAAVASLVQTSNNFGSTPYKSSLRIIELGFKYSF